MTRKILLSVTALIIIAMTLLSLRQARIVQVNRMSVALKMLQQEQIHWQRLRLQLAAAARPGMVRPDADEEWAAATDMTAGPPAP